MFIILSITSLTVALSCSPIGHSTMMPRRSLSRNDESLVGGMLSKENAAENGIDLRERSPPRVGCRHLEEGEEPRRHEGQISRESSVEERRVLVRTPSAEDRRLSRETSFDQSSAATDDFFLLQETAKSTTQVSKQFQGGYISCVCFTVIVFPFRRSYFL